MRREWAALFLPLAGYRARRQDKEGMALEEASAWSPISRVSSNPGIGSHTAIGFYPQHHTETNTMQELCGFSPPAAGLPFSWKTNSSAFPRRHSTSLSLCHTSFWLPGEGEGERVREVTGVK